MVRRGAGRPPALACRGGAVPVLVSSRRRGCSCSGRRGRREGPRERSRYARSWRRLPLLLWRTPPGLELILAQEGVPFEMVRDAHPLVVSRRPVRPVRRPVDAAALARCPALTPEHVAIDIDVLRRGEPCDPFDALVDTRAAQASWTIGSRKAHRAGGAASPRRGSAAA